MGVAHHVIRCHLNQETRAHGFDDVASTIDQSLDPGGGNGGGVGSSVSREAALLAKLCQKMSLIY
jgi:hypothetical protein